MSDHLIAPHGGTLVNLLVSPERAAELKSADLPSWDLTPRQICDLELLMNGAFSPLRTFLGRADYENVCNDLRLADGTLWPVPIYLDLPEEFANEVNGKSVALRDLEGVILAVLHVDEVYTPDREAEAQLVFGTTSTDHPGVAYLLTKTNPCYVSGRLEGMTLPHHYDFRTLRHTPAELRDQFAKLGWTKVVAFQTRHVMHRAEQELTLRAAKENGANLLLHPSVGLSRPGDADHYTRIRTYQSLLPTYPHNTAALSLLNLAGRSSGSRGAVWHALVRKNHGCTHFVLGRDHADASDLLAKYQEEIGVQIVPYQKMVYVEDQAGFMPEDQVPEGARVLSISDAELRNRLNEGRDLPEWFTFPDIARELRKSSPPRSKQGFTVFFTGLSGSGKSTIANVLLVKLLEMGGRPVTILDGDVVRKHLSSELGFSKEHRDINIRRIGYVASEITKNGGIAICAPIAPYDQTRKDVRAMIEEGGGFILVHVATSLEECEARDRKGFYAKARAGIIKEFTGISDPYEVPADAEMVIDTADFTAEEAAQEVILYLEREGYIGAVADEI